MVLGADDEGDDIRSAVVEPAEPVKKRPRPSGQQKVVMQALDDVPAQRGEVKGGELFPGNRLYVSLDVWREYCNRRSSSAGQAESRARNDLHKAQSELQDVRHAHVRDKLAQWVIFSRAAAK